MKTCLKNLFLLPALIAGLGSIMASRVESQTFRTLASFTTTSTSGINYTNCDGAGPGAVLILSGSTLYGTAWAGGIWNNGTVFAVNIDGTGFTNLHTFSATSGGCLLYTSDAADE